MNQINISMVAQKAQVSNSTVSRVLNNSPLVRPETASKVRAVIAELGYQPSEIARGLRMNETKTIGVIVSNVLNHFFTGMVRGIEDIANKSAYNIVLCNTDEQPEKEQQYLKTLLSKRVDGLIIASTGPQNDYSTLIGNLPVVFVDRRPGGRSAEMFDTILVDNKGGSFQAVEHLVQNGYRRIGIITGSNVGTTGSERLQGYKDALAAYDLPIDEKLIKIGDFLGHTAYQHARELLEPKMKCDAIFVANNIILLSTMKALHDCNRKCPRDIGLVAFDDMDWMEYCTPRFTAVAQPTYQMGTLAMEMLLERLSAKKTFAPKTIVLPVKLEVRDSSIRRKD